MEILYTSIDNFLQIPNPDPYMQSYVYVTFNPGLAGSKGSIIIEDKNSGEAYRKTVQFYPGADNTSNSFNSDGFLMYNIMEFMRKTSIFFNVRILSSTVICADIDSSREYTFTVKDSDIVSFAYFGKKYDDNKMIVSVTSDQTGTVTLEKVSSDTVFTFNLSAIFDRTNQKYPIEASVIAFNKNGLVALPYDKFLVMPSTCGKFTKKAILTDMYHNTSSRSHFLTALEDRVYNYGERIALSFLSDSPVTLKKAFYTNTGRHLESTTSNERTERHSLRTDFYDKLEVEQVEARHAVQVGYVDVYAMQGGTEASYPVRYNIIPRCGNNNEIFFLNRYGGVDSFNFTNGVTIKYSAQDEMTAIKTRVQNPTTENEIRFVNDKTLETEYTLKTHLIPMTQADLLSDLAGSKWCFLIDPEGNPRYTTIILNKPSFTFTSKDDEGEFEVTYTLSDH